MVGVLVVLYWPLVLIQLRGRNANATGPNVLRQDTILRRNDPFYPFHLVSVYGDPLAETY